MANFKRKNTTQRKKARRENPCDNWTTPKSIQRVTAEKKNFNSFIAKYSNTLLPVLEKLGDK